MSKALKWIPDKKDYIPYDLPDGACLYTDNMEQEIACCQCGKKVKFAEDIKYKSITAGVFKNNKISQKAHRALGFVPFANLYELKVGDADLHGLK